MFRENENKQNEQPTTVQLIHYIMTDAFRSSMNVVAILDIFDCVLGVTVMILNFRTDIPGQTVQTQIRLLLEEQSDQGLHCLPFHLHRLDSSLYGRAT